MSRLLDTYNEMLKTAEDESVVNDQVEILAKYASTAEEMLEQEYGDNYEADDVEKLAEYLINHDLEAEVEMDKIAELEDQGAIMARSFIATLDELEAEQE